MTQLYAQPYGLAAKGFYFDDAEEFDEQAKMNRNDYGNFVEEYEIQFIEGEQIDCALAAAFSLNQVNFRQFF